MPYKRGYRKRVGRRKRVTVRRYKRPNRKPQQNKVTTYVNRSIPVRDRMFCKLNFTDVFQYTVSVTGTLQMMRSYKSSCYRPRTDNTDMQPMWFDQICPTMYTYFRVYGVAYKIQISNATDSAGTWFAGVRPQNYNGSDTTLQALYEREDSKVKIGGPVSSSRSILYFKGYWSVAKVLGLARNQIEIEDNFRGDYTSDPTRVTWLMTYISSNGTGNFDVVVKLRYYVEFLGRVTPAVS